MAPVIRALVLPCVMAFLAHGHDETELHDLFQAQMEEEDGGQEGISLLQAQVEVKRVTHVDDEVSDEYKFADSLKCGSEEAVPDSEGPLTTPTAFAVAPSDLPATQLRATQTESDEPPGAAAMRSVLLLMTALIILDCIRRSWLQQQETKEPERCRADQRQVVFEDKVDVQAAWVKMVHSARSGDADMFEKALCQHSPVMRADAWGCTPLHFAAVGGSTIIATELLKRSAEINALDAADETALHIAAREGHLAICELFLRSGANIHAVSSEGLTPLVVAGLANQQDICRLLVDGGAGVGGLADAELPPLVVSQVVRKMISEPLSQS